MAKVNLLWLMYPPLPEQRWLAYHYTKLGRWTYFSWCNPQYQSRDDLHTITQNLADEPTLANGPHWYQSRDDLHTTTQNLADEPTLANGSSSTKAEMIAYHYTKLGRWTYFGSTQWQRFESSSLHHFWDTPQHFLKTCFSLESGFLSFLELQKSLLVSFQGCWTKWQRFESSSIHCFWDTPQHFLKTCFSLESGFLSFLEL